MRSTGTKRAAIDRRCFEAKKSSYRAGEAYAYRVGLVRSSREVHHAVEAGKGRAIALVAVAVKLLLCEDVSTVLSRHSQHTMHVYAGAHGGGEVNMGHGAQVPRRRTTP